MHPNLTNVSIKAAMLDSIGQWADAVPPLQPRIAYGGPLAVNLSGYLDAVWVISRL